MDHINALAAAAAQDNIQLDPSDNVLSLLTKAVTTQAITQSTTLYQQYGLADRFSILQSGTAHFSKTVRDENIEVTKSSKPFLPLGISGLNSPGRYELKIDADAGSQISHIELSKLWDIIDVDPTFGAKFMAWILARSTQLLWCTRGLDKAHLADQTAPISTSQETNVTGAATRMGEGAFFAPLGEDRLKDIFAFSQFRHFSKGDTISVEGQPSSGIYVLFSGRVESSCHSLKDEKLQKQMRMIARPGVALSWNNGLSNLPAPYTLIARRDSTLLYISQDQVQNMIAQDPMLAVALMQRQIWQVGRYQQTSISLNALTADHEVDLLDALLTDNAARIPVQSLLHGATHSLRNRFTRGHGFDAIYDAMNNGNDAERSIAGLMKDALTGMEREHRFFKQLNTVYARVSGAPRETDPALIKELSISDFTQAFDQVPYVIKGMENLPDEPRSIFFYNHIATSPTTALANGHIFAIDSHFVSVKILHARYRDGGKRIVRTGKKTEFSHHAYYSRMDNIFVSTPDSEQLAETQDEKNWRKELLFIEAQKVFDAGHPLAIAPEGTAATENNYSNTSPGPFKPGAFLLAAHLKPSPVLVPIALANFDHPVSRATYAAVIKPPIKISDYVKDVNDRAEMKAFMDDYRETFRTYVAEARELAEAVQESSASREGLVTNVGLVSPNEEEYEADIRALELQVADTARRRGKLVLYGSSTMRLWTDAERDLSAPDLVNLGFGGSTLPACRTYFDRMVVPHHPKTMVFYAGDNDIGGGATPEHVAAEFSHFMAQVAEKLPDTKCYVVSIKPSPFRANFLPTILKSNALIKELVAQSDQWGYIDFTSPMLDKQGAPSPMFYDDDPLHVNVVGYGLLSKLIKDALSADA